MTPARVGMVLLLSVSFFAALARAEWQREQTALAWLDRGKVMWRFSFDPKAGKPFFDPITVAGGPSFTNFKPDDHPWHYGLWFSWKYINRANYWEENRQTGKAEGRTTWGPPMLQTSDDGSALIRIEIKYTHPSGRVDLKEIRRIHVSAPASDGSYTIDWNASFTGGTEGALLDRTPMPGEPNGAVNGGYAGLGIRLAAPPLAMAVMTVDGPVTELVSDRARPSSPAVSFNFRDGDKDVGGIAIFSDPANNDSGDEVPWYLVNSEQMRFACAAVLAPKPIQLAAGAEWDLRYRIAVKPMAWTPEALQAVRR